MRSTQQQASSAKFNFAIARLDALGHHPWPLAPEMPAVNHRGLYELVDRLFEGRRTLACYDPDRACRINAELGRLEDAVAEMASK